jgi:hypothetical protein
LNLVYFHLPNLVSRTVNAKFECVQMFYGTRNCESISSVTNRNYLIVQNALWRSEKAFVQ